jgi:hypothetical protein
MPEASSRALATWSRKNIEKSQQKTPPGAQKSPKNTPKTTQNGPREPNEVQNGTKRQTFAPTIFGRVFWHQNGTLEKRSAAEAGLLVIDFLYNWTLSCPCYLTRRDSTDVLRRIEHAKRSTAAARLVLCTHLGRRTVQRFGRSCFFLVALWVLLFVFCDLCAKCTTPKQAKQDPESIKNLSKIDPKRTKNLSKIDQKSVFSGAGPPTPKKEVLGGRFARAYLIAGGHVWEPFWSLWPPLRTLGVVFGAFWTRQRTVQKQSAKNIAKGGPREAKSRPKAPFWSLFGTKTATENEKS